MLSFLRNGRRLEAMTLVDIASTLALITDQFGDIGRKVAYDGPAHAMATVRPDDLHRAVTDLWRTPQDRRRGGDPPRVCADQFTIDVEDDGPGISDALKQNCWSRSCAATRPATWTKRRASASAFPSQTQWCSAHGGALSLHDRQPHGLVVRMRLPVHQQSERPRPRRATA